MELWITAWSIDRNNMTVVLQFDFDFDIVTYVCLLCWGQSQVASLV